jgi:hypothetical protein
MGGYRRTDCTLIQADASIFILICGNLTSRGLQRGIPMMCGSTDPGLNSSARLAMPATIVLIIVAGQMHSFESRKWVVTG